MKLYILLFVLLSVTIGYAQEMSTNKPEDTKVPFMFVQTAENGTFSAIPGKDSYKLVLKGVTPQTVYFSDRPERIAGSVNNRDFLSAIGFGKLNPPNAAIVLTEPKSKDSDVIVVTLENPVYNESTKTLTYEAKPLKDIKGTKLAFWGNKSDKQLPSTFSKVSIFIDDCPDGLVQCYGNYEYGGRRKCRTQCGVLSKKVGYCWSITHPLCAPCRNHVDECRAPGAPCVNSPDPGCTARACSTSQDCM